MYVCAILVVSKLWKCAWRIDRIAPVVIMGVKAAVVCHSFKQAKVFWVAGSS